MTNVCRNLAAADGHARLPAPRGPRAAKGLAIVIFAAVLCAAVYLAAALNARSALAEQTLADARVALAPSMSRADCYAWLRAHHLIATNTAFTVWRKSALGAWYRSGDGAWPQPAFAPGAAPRGASPVLVSPDAVVKMSAGAACGMTTTERISFDRFDRIERVTASGPYWSCG